WMWCQPEERSGPLSGPQVRLMCISYGQTLSIDIATTARRLVMGPWYQRHWGRRVVLLEDQASKENFATTLGGFRLATSMGGATLGRGGDIEMLDAPEIAVEICRRIASGRTLLAVSRDADMPHHDAIYDEMARSPSFCEAIARARAESAHGLAMEALEIADAAAPGDNPQLVKNRCDQRRWLAGKYNAMYSDKLAVTDSDGG